MFFIGMMLKKQLVIVLVCILAENYFLNQAMTFKNLSHKTLNSKNATDFFRNFTVHHSTIP